jgi:D-glycero-D-manno-heptose 1,7-bisphosphate phosphatase
MSQPAVFVDRDGTINERPAPHRYIESVAEFRWLPGALAGLTRLGRAGFPLIVVSNQRGVARGRVSWEALASIESEIQNLLRPRGAEISVFRYCPHGLDDGCECRKPKPGLIRAAAEELGIDLAQSWMIGDADSDVQAGLAAGCQTVLIGREAGAVQPTICAANLLEASDRLLAS